MDGVSVQRHVHHVETDATHVLIAQHTLLGCPLEGSNARVLDLIEVLHGLGGIDQQVGAGGLGAEAPDLARIGGVPLVGLREELATVLGVVLGGALAALNVLGQAVGEGLGHHVDAVVLVGRLGQTGHGGGVSDGLTEGHDGVGELELNAGVLLGKILQANLHVQLTSAGDDVLARLLDGHLAQGVGLGQALETFHKLGQLGSVLGLHSHAHDGRHGELHDADVVRALVVGDGAGLDKELVNADKADGVTGRHILNGLGVTAHHQHGALDVLDVQVVLLAGDVVGAHDADLHAGLDGTREHTTEGEKAALVGGGHHLGDVAHEGTALVAVADGVGALVIERTLVEVLHTVALGLGGGRQMEHNHVQQRIGSGQELAHDNFQEGLANEVLLLSGKLDLQALQDLGVRVLLVIHDGVEDLVDGVHNELDEGAGQGLAGGGSVGGGPLLGGAVEEVVSPQLGAELHGLYTELGGVHAGEAAEGEAPGVEPRAERNGAVLGVHLHVTEELVAVGGDNHVGGLDGAREGLVGLLGRHLQLKKHTVNLIDHQHGLDAFTKGLAQHGLGLHAHTLNAVNHNKSTVSHTEGSRHLRREIDVTRGVDQVDEERVVALALLGEEGGQLGVELIVEGHASGLDGDTTLLLVGTGVGEASLTGLGQGHDPRRSDQGVSQGGLAVVDVGNHGHVTQLELVLHELAHLGDCEVRHLD
mmetsp:Transcript_13033/g.33263  ORF Transcript_13033/g.33263 Transcript_13033/m.33263 type:complete len:703 (+) Transcript_13033:530-2638(+)